MIKKLFLLSAAALITQNSYAFSPGTFPQNTLGNVTTFGSGTVGGGNLGASTLSFASDGTVLSKGPVTFNGSGAAKVTGELTAQVSKAGAAQAIGKFAAKLLVPVTIALSLYELYKELGFDAVNKPSGGHDIVQNTTRPGGYFATDYNSGPFATAIAACMSLHWLNEGFRFLGYNNINGQQLCQYQSLSDPSRYLYAYAHFRADGSAPVTTSTPISQQQLEDAIAQKSGWPSSSALARTVKDAVASGQTVVAEPKTITGPATTPGPSTTTTSPAQPATSTTPAKPEIVTTTTTTNNYQYAGNTVTVSTVTITNVTNNTTGGTTTETSTTNPEVKQPDEQTKDESPAVDSPLPEQPKLYTPVYPRGLEGVWSDKKSELTSTSLMRLIPSLMPAVGTGGSCPTMPINLNIDRWANFGTVDVAPPCFIWDFGKAIIILSALLLARALVFGG